VASLWDLFNGDLERSINKLGIGDAGLASGISLRKPNIGGEPILVRFCKECRCSTSGSDEVRILPNHKLIVIDLVANTELPLTELDRKTKSFNADDALRKTFSVTVEPGELTCPMALLM